MVSFKRDIPLIKRFSKNTLGRDFVVGDIHGHYTRLMKKLESIGFDSSVDRLFSVGDLVDRGHENEKVVCLIDNKWFSAVRGNHEDMLIESFKNAGRGTQAEIHFMNGGQWFYGLSSIEQASIAGMLETLPLAIEVETDNGIVGLVHAECPGDDWDDFKLALSQEEVLSNYSACAMWSRRKIGRLNDTPVKGIDRLVVGHTPVRHPHVLGNVTYIDTAGWDDGFFTILDLSTMNVVE